MLKSDINLILKSANFFYKKALLKYSGDPQIIFPEKGKTYHLKDEDYVVFYDNNVNLNKKDNDQKSKSVNFLDSDWWTKEKIEFGILSVISILEAIPATRPYGMAASASFGIYKSFEIFSTAQNNWDYVAGIAILALSVLPGVASSKDAIIDIFKSALSGTKSSLLNLISFLKKCKFFNLISKIEKIIGKPCQATLSNVESKVDDLVQKIEVEISKSPQITSKSETSLPKPSLTGPASHLIEKGETYLLKDTKTVLHRTSNPELSLNDLNPMSPQKRRQGQFVGLYTYDKSLPIEQSLDADRKFGSNFIEINIPSGSKILDLTGLPKGTSNRVTPEQGKDLLDKGFVAIKGRDFIGPEEWVLLKIP